MQGRREKAPSGEKIGYLNVKGYDEIRDAIRRMGEKTNLRTQEGVFHTK
jgi:hypothetical protein